MSWFNQVASAYGSYEGSKNSASQDQQQQQPESTDSGGGKMAGFGARDIGERVNQSLAVVTSTGDKFFGDAAKRGNPNLIQNSSTLQYVVIAAAILFALWILMRAR